MSKKSPLAINLEYAALRTTCALVNGLPYRVALSLAAGCAYLAFNVLCYKRARTLARIRGVFPEKSPRECRRIAYRSLANVFETAVEMMRAPKLDRAWMDRHILDGQKYKDKLQSYIDEGHGAVIMVPHAGNWYMAAWSMAKYGLPLVSIAATQRNPKITAWMNRQYGDIEIFERGSAKTLALIRQRLLSGHGFAILPDLRVPEPDVEVDFLRGKANVSHAGALFAVKCGAPLVVAMMRRENGRHVFDHIATLRPDPAATDRRAEAMRLTREAMRLLDARVQAHPEFWYWYNKRWILQPVTKKEGTK